MAEKHNALNPGPDEPDSGGEGGHEYERLLARACASLRLFGDKDNPLSLRHAMARTRREAENFRRWQESGAPISGIAVRLADGQEMALVKRNPHLLAATCSVRESLPGAVLHVYKKRDRRFGEVLLYSVEASRIPRGGYTYRKTYRNEQTLMLNFQRGPGGQLNVTIDYTPAPGGAAEPRPGWRRWAQPAVLALLAFAGALRLLRRRLRRDERGAWQPSWSILTALAVLVMSAAFVTLLRDRPGAERSGRDVDPSEYAVNMGRTPTPDIIAALHGRGGGAGDPPPGERAVRGGGQPEEAAAAAPGCSLPHLIHPAANSHAPSASPAGRAGRVVRVSGGGSSTAPPVAVSAPERVPIYVKAFVKNDDTLETELLRAFVRALNRTNRFDILTDEPGKTIPKDVYEVSLEFEPREDCYGTIFARLYDKKSGGQIWVAEKDCSQYPKGKLLADATQQLVRGMISRLKVVDG